MKKRILSALAAGSLAVTSLIALAPDASAADRTCRGTISNVTIRGNVNVPTGATCTLTNVIVMGDVKLARGSSLTATDGRVTGNIQGESAPKTIRVTRTIVNGNVQTKNATGQVYLNAARVKGDVQAERNLVEQRLYQARVGGDVQTKYMASRIDNSIIGGNIQHEEGKNSRFARNTVSGDVQVFKNRGEQRISFNKIRGNLQCKENSPRPVGGQNTVSGSKEDQCRTL